MAKDGIAPLTNDAAALQGRAGVSQRNLELDFEEIKIGVAEYESGPTGCTVFLFPPESSAAVDLRGGACGGLFVDQYQSGDVMVDALCWAGGGLLGLEAAAGVSAELFQQRGYRTDWASIPLVTGGVIYDFGRRRNAVYPDKELGRMAVRAAVPGRFPLGAHGAGCMATVGNGFSFRRGEPAGQGAAFRQVGSVKLAVFTVVNALGAIVDRDGRVIRGHLDSLTGERATAIEDLEAMMANPAGIQPGHTTLTLVVTNARLTARALRQFGRQVHTSMARAIHPFHTVWDGDMLWAVSTGQEQSMNLNETALGVLASELAWDAVLSCFD